MPGTWMYTIKCSNTMGDTVLGTTIREKDLGVTISVCMTISGQWGFVASRVIKYLD